MRKYYIVDDYAKKENVTPKTIYERVKQGKLSEVNIKQDLAKLVYEEELNNEAETVAFMNLKGGAGKTTISVHAASLLSKIGFKVLLIDTDHQNQCRLFFPEVHYEYSLKSALADEAGIEDCIYTVQTETSYLDIIHSSYSLTLFAAKFDDRDKLTNVLKKVKSNYDFIIIDTSPNFEIININVARASDRILVPLTPTTLHIEGMAHNFEALDKVAEIDTHKVLGIVASIYNDKKAEHRAYLELLKETYPHLMFENAIPQDTNLEKVATDRRTIFDVREKSKSSQSLKRFIWEMLRRL